MTMKPMNNLLLVILLSIICSTSIIGGGIVGAAEIGKPHSTVITLKGTNFDDHVNDPANGLWFLKFYAPWCGHCKKMAPVLDNVAPFLAGKMAIGKVDCTVEKSLCKRFNVKGYPTLKYYRDGDFQDYPLGRDADSIINFGEKLSNRAVSIVATYDEAMSKLLKKVPVAFLVYDPNASSSGNGGKSIDASGASHEEKAIEKLIQSTERTRVFGQVARKMQAHGSFGLLSLEDDASREATLAQFFGGEGSKVPTDGFIARIEEDVPIKVYTGEELTTASVEQFAKENNLAAVIELGGHNFRFVSRRGKPLAIAVYNPDDEVKTDKFKRDVKQYAVKGQYKDDYIFSTMDGIRWDKFLSQFSITKENLPELFILDVPARTYWQDASVFDIPDFINAVKNGEIESREQEKVKKGPLDEFLQVFVDYMPYSLMAMFGLFGTVFYLALPKLDSGLAIPPPPVPPADANVDAVLKRKPKEDALADGDNDDDKKDK